ncbi:MAG: M23 family metallopeptidase, partial [Rhodospirillales bacterium]|nr:M23 family metallopeptidase [Rhodospirillales bacterium]
MRFGIFLAFMAALILSLPQPADAQMGSGKRGMMGGGGKGSGGYMGGKKGNGTETPESSTGNGKIKKIPEQLEQMGLFAVGLKAVLPSAAKCEGIASPFGSSTRYDGSYRNNEHGGYHSGLDITLTIGTPLLAIADGEVIHGGEGGLLVGNFLWMRHAPEDTGLPFYAFVKYQHLDKPPSLQAGDKVKMGQAVGLSGLTGTQGGHYGATGYPHLHMTVYASDVS